MRFRPLLSILCVCVLLVLAGAVIVQAQSQGFAGRDSSWESRNAIGLPGEDYSDDDEGDDTGDGGPSGSLEVMIGEVHCAVNDYFGEVNGTVRFGGTSGLTPASGFAPSPGGQGSDDFGVYTKFEGDSCESFIGLAHTQVVASGCTAGPISPASFQDVVHFFFVCEGDRPLVAHAIGEMTRAVLAYSP